MLLEDCLTPHVQFQLGTTFCLGQYADRWGIYIYGPGSPPKALNPRAVSSVITGPPICYQDRIEWTVQSQLLVDICELQHLLWTLALHPLVISEFDIERLQSKARLLNGMLRLPCDRMCFTSSSFLLLPVTKANKVSSTVDWEWGLTDFFWPRHGSFELRVEIQGEKRTLFTLTHQPDSAKIDEI
jgi:hypothetical protein